MKLNARKLLLFSVQFVVFFLLLLWLYPKILPLYNQFALGLANTVLSGLTPPMRVEAAPDKSWRVHLLSGRPLFTLEADYLNLIYLNLVLLPALLLATPVCFLQRLKLLSLGLLLLLGVHAASAIAIVHSEVCQHYDPSNLGCNWLEEVFATGGQLFSVVLWGLLTWRYWFPKPVVTNERVRTESDMKLDLHAHCPCGSGKKYKRCCGMSR
jgi:hypothetical protein